MTITIRLKTDNAAFSEDRETEIRRILSYWVQRGAVSGKLIDYNGNTVGTVTVTGK